MTRLLFVALLLLLAASAADAAHRSLFGVRARSVTRERVVSRDRAVERPVLSRFRGSGCTGITAGGCVGAPAAAPVRVGAGCGGYGGPAYVAPAVPRVLPQPMPWKK